MGSLPTHDLQAAYVPSLSKQFHLMPHILHNSPSRFGHQSVQRYTHGRPPQGGDWNQIKIQAPSGFGSVGPRSPRSNSFTNNMTWGRWGIVGHDKCSLCRSTGRKGEGIKGAKMRKKEKKNRPRWYGGHHGASNMKGGVDTDKQSTPDTYLYPMHVAREILFFVGQEASVKKIVVVSQCLGGGMKLAASGVLVGFHGGTTCTVRDDLYGGGVEQIWACVLRFAGYVIINVTMVALVLRWFVKENEFCSWRRTYLTEVREFRGGIVVMEAGTIKMIGSAIKKRLKMKDDEVVRMKMMMWVAISEKKWVTSFTDG
ncbi:hypothetical protein V8G54_005110 [Vigna mungo]|uniref:Uncharacterized protein n=1 Tax=Vigna mungo TaxID=3915 RepID=A0AAQ3SG92_VIGMU